MSKPICPRCERETADGLLCNACVARGRSCLRKIARHYEDVYVRKSGGGGGSEGYASRVPISDSQTKRLSYVRNQLQTWVRELDMGDGGSLPDNPVWWALWLASRMERVRTHAAGDEAIDEFDYCAGLIVSSINPRHTMTGCGKCPICGGDVFAVDDEQMGTCKRCEEAGIVSQLHRLSQRQDLWEKVPDLPLPRRLLMEALPMHGIHIKPATFRQWVHRERLTPVGESNGAPLYLLSDVRKLLDDDAA